MKDVSALVHSQRTVRTYYFYISLKEVASPIGSLLVSGGYDLNVNIYSTANNKLKLGLKVCHCIECVEYMIHKF